jgi:hypothetical protein
MSELFPARSIAIEVIGCTDPARIREFNRWYDQKYLEELKQTPGVVDIYRYLDVQADFGEIGARFMAPSDKPSRYVTLYRLDGDDPWGVAQRLKADQQNKRSAGQLPDYFEDHELTVWDFVACRKSVSPPVRPETKLPDGMPEVILLVFTGSDPTRRVEHDDWWLFSHAHDLLETPGMTQCQRYRSLDPSPAEGDANSMNIYEFDTDDPVGAFRKILEDDRNVRRPQGRFSPFSRSSKPHASGLYRHWDPMKGRWQ